MIDTWFAPHESSSEFDYWWPISRIYFLREQTIWLIEHRWALDENLWPPELEKYLTCEYRKNKETGKIELFWEKVSKGHYEIRYKGKHHIVIKAPFVNISDIHIELTERLKTTKEAGDALLDEVIQRGARNYKDLSRPAKRVLDYICGVRRRRQTYPQWKAEQNYRRKNKR